MSIINIKENEDYTSFEVIVPLKERNRNYLLFTIIHLATIIFMYLLLGHLFLNILIAFPTLILFIWITYLDSFRKQYFLLTNTHIYFTVEYVNFLLSKKTKEQQIFLEELSRYEILHGEGEIFVWLHKNRKRYKSVGNFSKQKDCDFFIAKLEEKRAAFKLLNYKN